MNVISHSDSGVRLELEGETLYATHRMDRYVKPRRWWKPAEYVEIWMLEDGRKVRLCRNRTTGEWKACWRQ